MPFTPEQDAYILKAHFRSATRNPDGIWSYSLQSCIDQFTEAFPDVDVDYDVFRKHKSILVKRYDEKHCICKGKSTGRPTVLTENAVDDIRQRMEQSPKKSIPQLSAQTESAGLEVGDIIVRINDDSTTGLTHNEVHDLLLEARLELELGIRRGEINARIISDEDYEVEQANAIKRAIEEEVLNEAITIINNMKNSIDSSREKSSHAIDENLSGQEEIIDTVKLQSALEVKKGQKWSTFLIKPDKPIPKQKKKVEEPAKSEPYRVVIKKQSRRPSQEKRVQFDQNVTEVVVDFEDDETEEITHEGTAEIECVEVKVKVTESEKITVEETESYHDYYIEDEEEMHREELETGSIRDSIELDRERLESFRSVDEMEIKPSLEEQLLTVQKQLQALSQLPSAIQVTLDAISKQLASIVGARESAEGNGDQAEQTSSSKEEDEPQTEEEFLEHTSVSEKAEAELLREDSDANSSIGEDLEEDQNQEQAEKEAEEVEDVEEREPSPYSGLTEEEREEQIQKEQLEAKKQKVNHWNNVWPWSDKVKPVYRESNCWKEPSRAMATKAINFLKYQPPPKNLDYLQRSEVYRLVHDMEPPVRGITSRAEKVLAEQDYYEATVETR